MKQKAVLQRPPRRARVGLLGIALVVVAALALDGCGRSSGGSRGGGATFGLVVNEVVANASANVDPLDSSAAAVLIDPVTGDPMLDPEPRVPNDAADWVEIYNPLAFAVNLRGYTLSDNRRSPRKYRFPTIVIGPGEYVVVVCDGQENAGPMHASFRLDPDGETVYLFANDGGTLVDQLDYREMPFNGAVGRSPDGTGGRGGYDILAFATPRGANGPMGERLPRLGAFDATPSKVADSFDVVLEVFDDDTLGQGVLAATIEVQGADSCTTPIAGDEFGPAEPLIEDESAAVEFEELRLDSQGNPVTKRVVRRRFMATIAAADVPGFFFQDPDSGEELSRFTDGVLRFRIVVETALGITAGANCDGLKAIPLVINEYQPINELPEFTFDVTNAAGDPRENPRDPDWFELYNAGDEPICLKGYSLLGQNGLREHLGSPAQRRPACPCDQNSADCLFYWQFVCIPGADLEALDCDDLQAGVPGALVNIPVIQPGERIVLLADNDPPPFRTYTLRDGSGRRFHSTQFALNGDGPDAFALLDPNGVVVDRVEYDFSGRLPPPAGNPAGNGVAPNVSFGRTPDGFGVGTPLLGSNLDLSGVEPSVHAVFTCATPEAPNAIPCPVDPQFDPRAWMLVGGVSGRRCPTPAEEVEITALVWVDSDTVALDTPESRTFDVAAYYSVDGGPEVRVAREDCLLCRSPLFPIEPPQASSFDRDCLGTTTVAGATPFRARLFVPPQPAGSVVSFRFEAFDFDLGAMGVLEATAEPGPTFFFYEVEPAPSPLVFNEIMPESVTVLAELYSRKPQGFSPPEYAEIYNPSDATIDLSGAYLAEADARVDREGRFCPPDLVDDLRQFRIPDGTAIGPGEFLLFLFVDPDASNTEPDLRGQPFEDATVLVDTIRLDACRDTLILIGSEDDAGCQLAKTVWDFRSCADLAEGEECTVGRPDTAIGMLPDGSGQQGFQVCNSPPLPNPLVQLATPSPGAPNAQ